MTDDAFGDRHHLRIGDVASALGVKPHVLRYWEAEFPSLRPKKTSGAHRHYSREDVALLARIKELVVDRGFSIAGARRVVEGDRTDLGRDSVRAELVLARELLLDLLVDLGAEEDAEDGVASDGLAWDGDARVSIERPLGVRAADHVAVVAARPSARGRTR